VVAGACACVPVFLICALLPAASASPQSSGLHAGSSVGIYLCDGSIVYGHLERLDADSVVVVGTIGRVALARSSVRDVRSAGAPHKGDDGSVEYWFPNPNATRLVFGPTGRTLPRGEGYFADYDIAVGSAAVGITDRITIGGGGLLVPNSQLWFVTPKVGLVRGESFNLAIGALAGGWGGNGVSGIGYVVSTFGGGDRSLTLGVGNDFYGSRAREQIFMVGGEIRASRRISLMTENYVPTTSSNALFSYGIRFLGERFAVDLAFFNLARQTQFPGIPFVGFSVRF